jgi:hypothetical protein
MSEPAPLWRRLVMAAALLIPAIALGILGLQQLWDGMARDAAVPVPLYMVEQVSMPTAAYRGAAEALARANARDGEALLQRGEALLRTSAPAATVVAIAEKGLLLEPASARGWTVLAEALMVSDKAKAAEALSQALILAPRDYWLVAVRAQDSALLWDQLDSDNRQIAIGQARMLWQEPALHPMLFKFLKTPVGTAFETKAFVGEPDEIRAMNRWVRTEMRRIERKQRALHG